MGSVILSGGPAPSISTVSPDNFVFDGYSLSPSDGSIRVRSSNHDDVGNIDRESFEAPRVDGGGVLGHYYRRKDITLGLTLSASTGILLNTLIDDLKKYTKKTNGRLEIVVNGEVRRVMASVTNLKFNRQYYNITFCQDVEITFTTIDPHRRKKTNESLTLTGKSADFSEDIYNNGTVETYPIFYVLFGAVTACPSVAITIDGYTITVTQTFATNDILIIDGDTKEVTKNGTVIDYTGTFPKMDIGTNPTSFDFGAGTFVCDIVVVYSQKYK